MFGANSARNLAVTQYFKQENNVIGAQKGENGALRIVDLVLG